MHGDYFLGDFIKGLRTISVILTVYSSQEFLFTFYLRSSFKSYQYRVRVQSALLTLTVCNFFARKFKCFMVMTWTGLKRNLLCLLITGVAVSSECSSIRFLLKRHQKSITSFCSRVLKNRSVMLKL